MLRPKDSYLLLCHSVSCLTKFLPFTPLLPQTLVRCARSCWTGTVQFHPLQKCCPSTVALGMELGGTSPALLSTQLCVPPLCGGGLIQGAQEKGVGMWGYFNCSFPKCCAKGMQHSCPSVSNQEILCILAGLRLPSFKMFFPSASEHDEFNEQSHKGWI